MVLVENLLAVALVSSRLPQSPIVCKHQLLAKLSLQPGGELAGQLGATVIHVNYGQLQESANVQGGCDTALCW